MMNIIKALLSNEYEIIAVLGIEFSPSCAIKYQYTNKGIIKRQGIFIEILRSMLTSEGIDINFIGINRRGIKKSIIDIKDIFKEYKQNKLDSFK